MYNDRVMVEIVVFVIEEKRVEGRIVKVIKREIIRIVGIF